MDSSDLEGEHPSSCDLFDEEGYEIISDISKLPYKIQRRIEELSYLCSLPRDSVLSSHLSRSATVLGVSIRTMYRWMREYRAHGVKGVIPKTRSDKGMRRISEEWRQFILKTYRRENRGLKVANAQRIFELVQLHASDSDLSQYPSLRSVQRVVQAERARQEQKKSIQTTGWTGDRLQIVTADKRMIDITHSNQVWQCDHTPADILVIDRFGDFHRPNLTTVIDTYSRCLVGFHIGIGYPSAAVTSLAFRHAILPKLKGGCYVPENDWDVYGVPQFVYTDKGADFTSSHLSHVSADVGCQLEVREKPSSGGIIERPFGSFNTSFFQGLDGYTTNVLKGHKKQAQSEANLTLEALRVLLNRYFVDNYNQHPDPRIGTQSRLERWRSGLVTPPRIINERELDVLLMHQDKRLVYAGGKIRFARLVYTGEYLTSYVGQKVTIRYNPEDISQLFVYKRTEYREEFIARAYVNTLQDQTLSLHESKVINQHLRSQSMDITNRAVLSELKARRKFLEEWRLRTSELLKSVSIAATGLAPVLNNDMPISDMKVIESGHTTVLESDSSKSECPKVEDSPGLEDVDVYADMPVPEVKVVAMADSAAIGGDAPSVSESPAEKSPDVEATDVSADMSIPEVKVIYGTLSQSIF